MMPDDFVDRGEFVVVERGNDCSFGAQTLDDVTIVQVGAQNLDRHFAAERFVGGAIDCADRTPLLLADDPIFADGFPDHCAKKRLLPVLREKLNRAAGARRGGSCASQPVPEQPSN